MNPQQAGAPAAPGRLVGAGYICALLAGDVDTLANYLIAFTAEELLEAIHEPLGLLVRYLGYHSGKTPTEIGDALVRATHRFAKGTTE